IFPDSKDLLRKQMLSVIFQNIPEARRSRRDEGLISNLLFARPPSGWYRRERHLSAHNVTKITVWDSIRPRIPPVLDLSPLKTDQQPLYGILFILTAGLLLATHDGISKLLTQLYPVFLVAWARYLSQTLLMLALFAPRMKQRIYRTQRPLAQLARGLSLVSITLLFFTGLKYIPLAEATAVMFLTPLLVTLASADR